MTGNPSGSGQSQKFWDKLAKKYSRQPVGDEEAYQTKLAMTREHFRPDMDLLEIGCGTGSTAIAHAPHVRSIRAVDISPAMLEIARTKARDAGIDNIEFAQATVAGIEAEDGQYDMVLALSLLHLLEDWQAVIAEVHRWLKPGGLFITSTACMSDMLPVMKYVLPLARLLGKAPKVMFFSLDELKQAHHNAGFEILNEFQSGPRSSAFLIARA
ncbi:MAG: class I SAM-dependent methyltransferase [Novosphingobium sp.]|nr:class I SAM-dependent methyltransferase [Novosphingobium sp.]